MDLMSKSSVSNDVDSLDPHGVARRLAALPEAAMRAAVLRDLLVEAGPESAAWLLDALATAGRAGGPPFDVSLIAAVDLANGELLPYEHQRAIFEAAERQTLLGCKELLFSAHVGDHDDEAAARPRPLVPGTRPLTLGERKSLARRWDRDVLAKLLVDPHADVVTLLLANPRLTEDDVLRIATARRASAAVLEIVLATNRWKVRPRVRKALLRNPKLPEANALRLVGLLNRQDLLELNGDPKLPLRVVAAIARRLRPPT